MKRTTRPFKVTLLSTILPLAMLALAIGTFLSATGDGDGKDGYEFAYVTGTVNVRSCPRLSCAVLAAYGVNQQVSVIRTVTGDEVDGSTGWSAVQFQDRAAYIHGSFLEAQPPALGEWLETVLAFSSVLTVLVLGKLSRTSGQQARRLSDAELSGILTGLTITVGLTASLIALSFSRVDSQSLSAFLSSALLNIGSGLIGAAIAFVLFQSIWRDRTAVNEQTLESIARLERELQSKNADMLEAMKQQSMELRQHLDAKLDVPTIASPSYQSPKAAMEYRSPAAVLIRRLGSWVLGISR